MEIHVCQTDEEVRACYPALRELRPHLVDEATFIAQAQRQMAHHGYLLAAAIEADEVVAVTGFRVAEYLAWGLTLYVDDLVTRTGRRKAGYGGALLDWLIERARAAGCAQFHLDSGVRRHAAHRLYLGRKLDISSHHFSKRLV